MLPLGPALGDNEYLLILTNESADTDAFGFIIVSQSTRLNDLSPTQILAIVQEFADDINILEASLIDTIFSDEQRANLVLEIETTKQSIRCRQQVAPSQPTSFLIVGCGNLSGYGQYATEIADMLASFQPLTN